MSSRFTPIILAGGVGKRLWPLSTESNPKQFLPIFKDLSLFDLTLQRLNNDLFNRPIVVTADKYLFHIIESINKTELDPFLIVLEPTGRNTFASITTAVKIIQDSNELDNDSFLVMPSDHYISNTKNFFDCSREALIDIKKNSLLLFGVEPENFSCELGYIQLVKNKSKEVKAFLEKPSNLKVRDLLKKDQVFWNSGIFAFKGSWFLDQVKEINKPFLLKVSKAIKLGKKTDNLFFPQKKAFNQIDNISFDKGFVERINKILMIRLNAGWSDLGSWAALRNFKQNQDENFLFHEDFSGNKTKRPWGYFKVLLEDKSSKVKLIKVMPFQKLSLQKHKHRSETWFVIRGKAKVTREKEKFTLEIGDSIDIKKNQIHSLENIDESALEIIEIQTGEYLGEDDIIRIEDIYGRADLH